MQQTLSSISFTNDKINIYWAVTKYMNKNRGDLRAKDLAGRQNNVENVEQNGC